MIHGLPATLNPQGFRQRPATALGSHTVEQHAAALPGPALHASIAAANAPHAWLGLCGDKAALRATQTPGLLWFAPRDERWIALADPSGSRQGRALVLDEFLLRSRAAGATPVFYQADQQTTDELRQRGFRAWKLGEEARVPLTGFTLDGGARKAIRANVRKLEAQGLRFEIRAQPDALLLLEAAELSRQWLRAKRSREKQFSLGRFSVDYLRHTPLALVWRGSELLAFANLLTTVDHSVLSVDLMRYGSNAPANTMDFLFARLMQWAAQQGYAEFSLGMTPLANIADDPRTPHWPRFARLLWRFGERYYNFQGVRRFKEKWQPTWQPRFLVCPRRRDCIPALVDCAVLIAGGKRALLGWKR